MLRPSRSLAVLAALAAGAAACSFLIQFDDQPIAVCDGGVCDATAADVSQSHEASTDAGTDAPVDADPCTVIVDGATIADGGACGAADPCNEKPTCEKGRCTAHPREAGTFCQYLGGCNCGYCNGSGACTTTVKCPEGFEWEAGNDLARCCGGLPVTTNTNANCGVCGIVCKTAGVTAVQDCQLLDGHYLCVGCGPNSECWSQCCSTSPAPTHCAASDCNTGACPAGICPSPSHCVSGTGNNPNYCSY